MAELTNCSKCGSKSMIPGVRVSDRTGHGIDWNEMQVSIDANPTGMFKGRARVKVTASVCGACGFMEFAVADPSALMRAHEEAVDRARHE